MVDLLPENAKIKKSRKGLTLVMFGTQVIFDQKLSKISFMKIINQIHLIGAKTGDQLKF